MIRKLATGVICALFIILFIYTGLNKLMDLPDFRSQLVRSPFIGSLAGITSMVLPAGELLIAAALIHTKTRSYALYLSLFVMALFTGYIWLMFHYAPDLPCTCGGIIAQMTWTQHLYFNATFTMMAIAGILIQPADSKV